MARDHFAALGLTPGRYDPREIAARFAVRRAQLTGDLLDPTTHDESRRRLEELHMAFAVLREPRRQEDYLRSQATGADRVAVLRQLIAASLEGGLLRCSRREAILGRARELGLSEFHTQLLIAEVQFGDDECSVAWKPVAGPAKTSHPRAWARVAAVGVLALAMFLGLVQWIGG